MTPQQIKDNAPCGATHYMEYNGKIFYVMKEMVWFRNAWCFATFKEDAKIIKL